MTDLDRKVRVAGWLYLLSSLPAPFSLLYLPGKILVAGDAAATADRIRASEMLFRWGIAAELLSATLFLWMGLAMYELFRDVDRKQALALLTFVVISVPISYANEWNRLGALSAATAEPLADALVLTLLHLHNWGLILAQVVWGLWLFPFGALVLRSGFLPRVLGYLLVLAGIGYVAASASAIVAPELRHLAFTVSAALGAIGELATMLWMIIMGAGKKT
jgi:hypothetical protein